MRCEIRRDIEKKQIEGWNGAFLDFLFEVWTILHVSCVDPCEGTKYSKLKTVRFEPDCRNGFA